MKRNLKRIKKAAGDSDAAPDPPPQPGAPDAPHPAPDAAPPPPAPHAPAPLPTLWSGAGWKHGSLGVQGYVIAKRKATCCFCRGPINKGNDRFIIIENANESEKSIHALCIPSLSPELLEPSRAWLHENIATAIAGSYDESLLGSVLASIA